MSVKALNLVAVVLAIVLFVSWLSVAFYPSLHDFMDANPFWNGLQEFNSRFGAESVADLAGVGRVAEGDVLVVIPYLPYQPGELETIAGFVVGGGTLLLMDDYGYGNQVLERLGLDMRFDGDPLLDPYLTYRNQRLPLAADLAEWLKLNGVEQVAMDGASSLDVSGPYQVLARSSDTSFVDRDGSEVWEEGEPEGPFVVAAQASVGRGRVVAVSDPSIAINSMLDRGDNLRFLEQVIGPLGQGGRVYVDTSHLSTSLLDRAKFAWDTARQRMGEPYAQILLIGFVLAAVWAPFRGKGGKIERKR